MTKHWHINTNINNNKDFATEWYVIGHHMLIKNMEKKSWCQRSSNSAGFNNLRVMPPFLLKKIAQKHIYLS